MQVRYTDTRALVYDITPILADIRESERIKAHEGLVEFLRVVREYGGLHFTVDFVGHVTGRMS